MRRPLPRAQLCDSRVGDDFDPIWCEAIWGCTGGYNGFVQPESWITRTPAVVQDIHRQDGIILVSDRGNPPHMEMAKTLQKQGIKQYFVIGGDGTQTGAMDTFLCTQEIGHEVAVVGVPKTIDNIFQSYFNLGHVFRFQHCLRGSGEGNFFCVRGGDLQLSLHWSGEAHGPPWRLHRFQCRSCCSKRGCLPPSGDGKLSG